MHLKNLGGPRHPPPL